MYVFLIILVFFIPLLFRQYFNYLQVALGIIWFVAITSTPNIYPPSNYELVTERLVYILLPSWIFGSLLALSKNSKETSEKACQSHVIYYHSIKKKF